MVQVKLLTGQVKESSPDVIDEWRLTIDMPVWELVFLLLLVSPSLPLKEDEEDTVAEDIGVHQLERLVELLTSSECKELLVALSNPEENVFQHVERLSLENNPLPAKPRAKRDTTSLEDGEAQCRADLTTWLEKYGSQMYYDRLSRALHHIGRPDIALGSHDTLAFINRLEVAKDADVGKLLAVPVRVQDQEAGPLEGHEAPHAGQRQEGDEGHDGEHAEDPAHAHEELETFEPRPPVVLKVHESLVIPEKFQHILRVLNTNIDGRRKIAFAITAIKGVGRRYAHVVLRKADIDLNKRAGELTEEEVERVVTIMQNPRQYKIPDWFLNRQKDVKDGKFSQVLANGLDNKLREDLERLKKIRAHRGLRHFWGLRVRGQHTKTTGRRGRTVGVSKKK
uniref:uncharacterized protein LOC131104113 isoform X3 n=1 Tax=Doryrhamphus excisus TaxID=161450 RepID=UPI0025ADDF80|nr:uncharacterized protein LOC131104113 isoform X3 [Doryrhamphus excisus]